MEQIIAIILTVAIGAAWDAYSKHRKARRRAAARVVSDAEPHEMPWMPEPPAPVRIEMPMPGDYAPLDAGTYHTTDEEMAAFAMEPAADADPADTDGDARRERWRRAIIDSEILTRKYQ